MRAPNFYAHPGFERAGLRRRDSGWIRERIADPASLFVPVWRNQNLVIELDDAEPRAVVLAAAAVAASLTPAEERLARGDVVFLGVVEERAHVALPGVGGERDRRGARPVYRSASARRTDRAARRGIAGARPGDDVLARAP